MLLVGVGYRRATSLSGRLFFPCWLLAPHFQSRLAGVGHRTASARFGLPRLKCFGRLARSFPSGVGQEPPPLPAMRRANVFRSKRPASTPVASLA
jgi:hypothetical protein